MKVNFTNFFFKMKNFCRITIIPFTLIIFSFTKMLKPEDIDHRMEKMYEAANKQLYTTDQSIKIVMECYKDSKKIKYKRGIKQSGLFLMILYITKFDCNNALKISNEIESTVIEYRNYKNIAEYHLARAQCYIETGLLNDGYEEYIKAKNAIEKIENSDEKYYKKSEIYLHIANYHSQTVEGNEDSIIYYTKKALAEGEKISNKGKLAESGKRNDWLVSLNLNLGNCYLTRTSPDINTSRIYYQKARHLCEMYETKIQISSQIQLFSYLSHFYYQDKNYKESVYSGLKSLELQKQNNDPYSKQIAYEYLAKSYLELGKEEEYQKYMDKYVTLTDSIKVYDKLETSKSLETIVKKKEDDNAKRHNSVLYISGATILIIVSCFLFLWRHRDKKIHSNYLAIIESIKNEKKIKSLDNELAFDEKVNTFNIPEETYHKILIKMNRFEKNLGFLKNDITLSYLSNQFKTNPKSLSAVIKSSTNKNFNNYINDLRINYIIHKLYENKKYREYKINYLSEECGFSSPKVFVTAFKKLTGVTPSYYITNLKKDNELKYSSQDFT